MTQLSAELTAVPETAVPETAAPQTAGPAKPLRADAVRNRTRLLEVAADVFTEQGVDAALEEIARRSGVGIGTLYRHFPTREALVLGVYRSQIDDLHARADHLAVTEAPVVALQAWMRSFVEYAAVKRGMVAMLRTLMQTDGALFDGPRDVIRAAAQKMLDNAEAAGLIRPGVTSVELLRALGGICMATDQVGSDATAAVLVDIVFDGLRYGAPGPART